MENSLLDLQIKYLKKIYRELALLNILLFLSMVALGIAAFLNWAL